QLVGEESTATVLAALWEVIERQGVFCALYSDRGSHFWLTPKVGGKVDPHRLTQVGRALRELGVQTIPAYLPQARGRSERNFGTWQGRLPQELRLRGIQTVDEANRFLREHYIAEFNRRFQVAPAQRGNAFVACRRKDLDLVFSLQFERTVHQHLDGTISLTYGPHRLGRYTAQGVALTSTPNAVEKTQGGKVHKPTFPPCLEIPLTARDSHFPTATTATVI